VGCQTGGCRKDNQLGVGILHKNAQRLKIGELAGNRGVCGDNMLDGGYNEKKRTQFYRHAGKNKKHERGVETGGCTIKVATGRLKWLWLTVWTRL